MKNKLTNNLQLQASTIIGFVGECMAVGWLTAEGFTSIICNWTSAQDNGIDIIALNPTGVQVLIDVKTSTGKNGGGSLTKAQKEHGIVILNFKPFKSINPMDCFSWQNHK